MDREKMATRAADLSQAMAMTTISSFNGDVLSAALVTLGALIVTLRYTGWEREVVLSSTIDELGQMICAGKREEQDDAD